MNDNPLSISFDLQIGFLGIDEDQVALDGLAGIPVEITWILVVRNVLAVFSWHLFVGCGLLFLESRVLILLTLNDRNRIDRTGVIKL